MHASDRSRRPRPRAHIGGGALVRLLAGVVLVVIGLAAWRHHQRGLAAPPDSAQAGATAARPVAPAPARPTVQAIAAPAAPPPGTDAPPSTGQRVYQCTSGANAIFQAEPCPVGATTEWSREATAEDLALIADYHAAEAHAVQEMEAKRAALVAQYAQMASAAALAQGGGGAVPPPADPRAANCAAAKAYRDAQLAKAGLDRDFNLIRKLDDIVYQACK